MIKLYYTKGACSLVVRIILNESGMAFEDEAVDLRSKKTATDKIYTSINPKGAVPALRLSNGEILTENAVILQYIADEAKAFTLLPPIGDLARYRVLEWLNYMATELHKGIGLLFNPSLSEVAKNQTCIPLIKTKLTYVDHHLAHHEYLLGDQFTLPDAYLFVMLRWATYFKFDLKEWPALTRYSEALSHRQSIMTSLAQEA